MNIYVSGSIAYDRIMDFPGYFAEHILPEKIHMLNVSFTVNNLTQNFGGTAGNIAYALSLLGERPLVLAAIGQDYQHYFHWLEENGIETANIRIVWEEFTAGAYITTDLADNQITGFNPGAMKYPSLFDFSSVISGESLVIIAPGNLEDMASYSRSCRERDIPFVFDPGQSLPAWQGEELTAALSGSRVLISNDYELELICDKTGLDEKALLEHTGAVVTTLGERGSRVRTANGVKNVPAVKPETVADPTGAGDAYRAGLLQGMVLGEDIVRCALRGSAAASFAVESQGTQTYCFMPEEYTARLEEYVSAV